MALPLKSLEGMSGGLILGFRTQPRLSLIGSLLYRVAGIANKNGLRVRLTGISLAHDCIGRKRISLL